MPNNEELALAIKQRATQLGFSLSGIAASATPARLGELRRWLENGYAGQMTYIEQRFDAYADPKLVLDGCRTIVMLAMQYGTNDRDFDRTAQPTASPTQQSGAEHGKVARYASFDSDYHDVIHKKLKELKRYVVSLAPNANVRGVVDTAPLLEREFAARAGLGWIGKNTLLLNRQYGSYFFLAALLTDLELPVDTEQPHSYCGTCTACLDACPTGAFPAAYTLDATKCISYLTIEHREMVEAPLVPQLDGWVFGCDVCQEVCPWNRKSESTEVEEFRYDAEKRKVDIREMLRTSEEDFRSLYRKTPFWRNKRRGLVRNALLLTVSNSLVEMLPEVENLVSDDEPLIAEAAKWAAKNLRAVVESKSP